MRQTDPRAASSRPSIYHYVVDEPLLCTIYARSMNMLLYSILGQPGPRHRSRASINTPGRTRWLAAAAIGAALAAGFAPLPAQALSWSWSFSRAADAQGPAVDAGGELITDDVADANGDYTLLNVVGQRNGVPIQSLLPNGSVAPGNCTLSGTCFAADNLLRRGVGGAGQLTKHGFNVALADGSYANYFWASFLSPPAYREFYSTPPFDPIPATGLVPPDTELNGAFRATPAPGPLPLLGLLAAWRHARTLRRLSTLVS